MQTRGPDWVVVLGIFVAFGMATDLLPLDQHAAVAQDVGASPELSRPTRHFKVDRPADLSDAAALTLYLRVLDQMVSGYRISDLATAGTYRSWRRYNKTPYRSATHGERFVNNYGNTIAKSYGNFEAAGDMPVGSVLAKDSIAVTTRGDVFLGPLFLMEKMAPGFSPESRDWCYTMIMPDGSLFGATHGEGSERVKFCITCHEAAGDENDHLFFVPEDYRVKIISVQPESK
jgi:hypothetical protein